MTYFFDVVILENVALKTNLRFLIRKMIVWIFYDVKVWIKTYIIHTLDGSGYGERHNIQFSIYVLIASFFLKISYFSWCWNFFVLKVQKQRDWDWNRILIPYTFCIDPTFFVNLLLGHLYQFKIKYVDSTSTFWLNHPKCEDIDMK